MQFVVQSGSEPGKTYDLGLNGFLSVGRQSANDIVVSDEQVSRRHAEIKGVNGGALVTDLGSSNGTFVNGARVSSPQMLKPNDTLQVGTTVLRLVDTDTATSTMPAGYDPPAPTIAGNYSSGFDNNYQSAANQAPASSVGQPASYNNYQQYQQPPVATPPTDTYNAAGANSYGQPVAYNQASANNAGYNQAAAYDPNQVGNPGNYGGYNQPPASVPMAANYNNSGAFQPDAYQPQAPTPAFGAAVSPVKPKRGLPLPALLAIAALIAIAVIGIILFVVLGKGGGSTADIAQPPNATKLNLSLDDLKKVPGSTLPADTSGISIAAYSTKDSPETVSKFYSDDLTKKGWSVTPTANSVNATKGDQTISLSILPLATQQEIDGISLALPGLKSQLHTGDTLVLGGQGPTSKMKTTSTGG